MSFGRPLDGSTSKKANSLSIEYRRARAELKADIRLGSKSMDDVIKELKKTKGSKIYAYMRVFDLLRAIPSVGKKRATDFALENNIDPGRRIGGLGTRQWQAIKEFAKKD